MQPQQPLLGFAAVLSCALPDAGACCDFGGLATAPLLVLFPGIRSWMLSRRSRTCDMLGRSVMSWAQQSAMSSRTRPLRNLGSGRR